MNTISIKKEYIKMKVTPEQSKQVQEICFKLGIYWANGTGSIQWADMKYLYLSGGKLSTGDDLDSYYEDIALEVSAEEFIKTKGFTEKPKASKKDKNKGIPKKILKKFIKRIKKEQKNKIYSEVTTYNKCADILKDIVLEVSKSKNKKKGE